MRRRLYQGDTAEGRQGASVAWDRFGASGAPSSHTVPAAPGGRPRRSQALGRRFALNTEPELQGDADLRTPAGDAGIGATEPLKGRTPRGLPTARAEHGTRGAPLSVRRPGLLELRLQCIEVEARSRLHRRELDRGLGDLGDLLLHELEAPELVGEGPARHASPRNDQLVVARLACRCEAPAAIVPASVGTSRPSFSTRAPMARRKPCAAIDRIGTVEPLSSFFAAPGFLVRWGRQVF